MLLDPARQGLLVLAVLAAVAQVAVAAVHFGLAEVLPVAVFDDSRRLFVSAD